MNRFLIILTFFISTQVHANFFDKTIILQKGDTKEFYVQGIVNRFKYQMNCTIKANNWVTNQSPTNFNPDSAIIISRNTKDKGITSDQINLSTKGTQCGAPSGICTSGNFSTGKTSLAFSVMNDDWFEFINRQEYILEIACTIKE